MRKDKHYKLNEDTIKIIEKFAEKNTRGNATEALEKIVTEYANKDNVKIEDSFIQMLSLSLLEKMKPDLTRIRLGSNGADKNTQIILELINGLYNHLGITSLVSTEDFKMPPIEKAETVVKNRIAYYRSLKLGKGVKDE